MKTIMSCLALVALAVFTSAAFAQEPILTSAEAKFDTATDNKDQQTKLDVYIKNSDGQSRPLEQEFYPHRHVTGRGQPNERRSHERQRFADSPPAKKEQMVVQLHSYSQVL
jgi:hypothetical protein